MSSVIHSCVPTAAALSAGQIETLRRQHLQQGQSNHWRVIIFLAGTWAIKASVVWWMPVCVGWLCSKKCLLVWCSWPLYLVVVKSRNGRNVSQLLYHQLIHWAVDPRYIHPHMLQYKLQTDKYIWNVFCQTAETACLVAVHFMTSSDGDSSRVESFWLFLILNCESCVGIYVPIFLWWCCYCFPCVLIIRPDVVSSISHCHTRELTDVM